MKALLKKFIEKRRKKLTAYRRELVMHEMHQSMFVETDTRLTVLDELNLILAELKK